MLIELSPQHIAMLQQCKDLFQFNLKALEAGVKNADFISSQLEVDQQELIDITCDNYNQTSSLIIQLEAFLQQQPITAFSNDYTILNHKKQILFNKGIEIIKQYHAELLNDYAELNGVMHLTDKDRAEHAEVTAFMQNTITQMEECLTNNNYELHN